ncbi:MAG: hypothetical protein QOJ13_3315 [Gaiellales bacterium]|jgi:hypothetical protein|nr:hypothetical protein [Gaiellales bacterium]
MQRATQLSGRLAAFAVLVIVSAAGCGGSSSTQSSGAATSTGTSTASTTTPTPASGPFVSTLYGYTVESPDWTGVVATTAWDGTGSPGSGDPTVDRLVGPDSQQAFGVGAPTKATLEKVVAKARATNASARGCPKPEAIRRTTVANEPAIIDEGHCNGVFVLSAYVIHAGRELVFFTFDQPGKEAAMRAGFRSLLKTLSFV